MRDEHAQVDLMNQFSLSKVLAGRLFTASLQGAGRATVLQQRAEVNFRFLFLYREESSHSESMNRCLCEGQRVTHVA